MPKRLSRSQKSMQIGVSPQVMSDSQGYAYSLIKIIRIKYHGWLLLPITLLAQFPTFNRLSPGYPTHPWTEDSVPDL
jgi:hypothetical protein